ncbi:exodeoxyribonuclease V subunit gamma [Arenimonas caeni]|jgi:exodeoxyribonuclease V gamma subunit|uniref:exodeoxyribonuclease V subunit gamma n=1 Tax=Arenimonas caeni TaxID=2058085 RepID=UPI002A36E595|nr:exodeoxyribonuclease V subunit gamma [Arenimonas caeni]MDY0021353.1 exodeoxyribonuclease V subunit gamma [Arenimonas caeni]
MDGDWKQRASEGITVFRASRLEALLVPLDHLLVMQPPEGLLAPHTVVAAHPGMRQWLAGALAARRGSGGIVANLDILLPSGFLDRLAGQVLGRGATSPAAWRREHLRWRLFDLLGRSDDPTLRAALEGDDSGRRRFQLADRLARIHTQYMAYRPDWLQAWAAGQRGFAQAGFHPALWRALREAVGEPHRGERLAELERALTEGQPDIGAREPLHVFGLSHLAPAELRVLHALAAHRPVVFYVPDPCREYWGGLKTERARLLELAADPHSRSAEDTFLGQAHPLLAAWGRLGQHFMLQVQALEAAVDMRHYRDEHDHDREPSGLLERLQESLRRLDPGLLAADPRAFALRRADASLRVHACHTRLRELEALRDAILQARRDDPTLLPGDIVVMAPDIRAYLPLLPAVFGAPGDPSVPLPYHLADVPTGRAQPLLAAFRQLLGFVVSRGTAPELLDLLSQPDIARRLGLDEDGLLRLEQALAGARAAWGLDPDARAALGVPGIAAHTLSWAMDRLIASHVHGEDDPASVLDVGGERIAPVPGVAGAGVVLGALDHALAQIAALRADAARPRPASAWAARLESLLDALFQPDPAETGAREAMDTLRAALRALAAEPAEAGLDPALDFAIVRAWVEERLAAVPERQRFLAGGMTVCGMVPQRAIPFRFIAVLGLDEGDYPRQDHDAGLDPIRREGLRRLGDRDTRSDDRYLFLETVMAARGRLHLSWQGFDARDGSPRNPAAPLAELMAALPPADDTGASPPWRIDHPLQPFDAACFGADPALRSSNPAFAAMVGGAPDAPGLLTPLPGPMVAGGELSLRRVFDWCRDPARTLLADGLGVRLDALAERHLSADEPLEAKLGVFDRQARAICEAALSNPDFDLDGPPPEHLVLGGVLPPMPFGDQAWQAELKAARGLVEVARAREAAKGLVEPVLAPPVQPAIAREVAGFRLAGEPGNVRGRDDALFVTGIFPHVDKESALGFRDRLPLFLSWALCRLAPENLHRRVRVLALVAMAGKGSKPPLTPWQDALAAWDDRYLDADAGKRAEMAATLEGKLGLVLSAAARPPTDPWPYFPHTSWALAQDKDAEDAWLRERSYGPGYARLLGRGIEPGEDESWRAALADLGLALKQAMDPDDEGMS